MSIRPLRQSVRPSPVFLALVAFTAAGGVLAWTAAQSTGPAARAGLQAFTRSRDGSIVAGDVITAVNDEAIASLDDLLTLLEKRQPGDTVTLTLSRAGRLRKQAVLLASE